MPIINVINSLLISSPDKVTINSIKACIGEQITVNFTLDVPNVNDNFFSILTNFIVGDSDIPISQFSVEGTGFHGGVDLSKLTVTAIPGNIKSVQGTITSISYTPADNGFRLGCSNDYYINGSTSNRGIVSKNTTIKQARTCINNLIIRLKKILIQSSALKRAQFFSMKVVVQTLRNASKREGVSSVTTPSLLY